MTRPSATVQNRRHHLLSRSALAGLGFAVAIGATPALAQVTGVGTVTSTASNGGAVGVASGGGVTDITLGASRSIVNWSSLGVTAADTLNFHFDNRGDIVLNRVTGSASIDGVVNGCMATCSATGGNVWVLSSGGVMIGANARINTGGFLASTGGLTDPDFLDGDMNFAFTGAPTDSTVSVASGAQITTHGGALALIAPIVTMGAGSTLTGADGGDVVYGSAENYNVTFAPTGADDLDLITFEVPSRADGGGGTPGLTLNGTTTANQVFAAIVSKSGVAASILLGGSITATTAAGENGDIVLLAGAGFVEGFPLNPGGGFEGSITQNAGAILTGTNVTMRAADNIVVDRIDATGQVWLDSAWGGISQTGAITAASLRVEAGAGIDLTDAGNDFDTISLLDNNGSGVISLTDADGFNIAGGIDNWVAAGTVNLTALNGSITQSGMGRIWAGRLNASATGDIALGNLTNHLTTLGTLTAGGAISYRGGTNFNLDGAVTAASLTLRSDTGAITQTGGPLNVGQLSVQAETGINLNLVNNQIDEITGLSTTSGDIILISGGDLSLAGNLTGAASVSLRIFNGGITQNSGVITAANFSATADAGLDLGGANQVTQLAGLSAGGTGDITFRNAGNLVLTGNVTAAAGNVTLYSTSGGINQASGAITADQLTAAAAGDIDVNTATNDVTTIGGLASSSGHVFYRNADSFDIQGDITTATAQGAVLRTVGAGAGITQTSGTINVGWFGANTSGSIAINGAANQIQRLVATNSNAGNVSISTTTDLAVGQPVTANQTVSLTSGGRIYEDSAGYIVANTLNLSAVTGISLPNAGQPFVNSVQNLGTITNTTSGGVVIANYSGSNTGLTGNISAAGQSVSITDVAGGVIQTGGIITADTLSLSATGGINATRNNSINSLGPVASGGGFSFVNAGPLFLTGNIASAGQTVSLTTNSGQIEQTGGGIITADRLNLAAGGRIWVNNANAVTSLGTVTAGGHVLFRNDGDTVVGGDITANGFDVTLRSNGGSVTQTAGSDITSNSLQVIAATGVTLTNAGNAINELAWLQNTSGGAAFGQNNGFQVSGLIWAAGQTLSLSSANGAIAQTSGTLTAGTLNASAAGTLTLNQANNVNSLGVIDAGGSFLFRDVDGFDLTGDVTAANQVVMLAQGGSISQTGGVITAADINALASADLLLGAANQIGAVSSLSAGQNLLYRQVGDLSVPTISAIGTVSLYSTTGDITQTGTITADTLALGAGGDITLGENFVSRLGRIEAGGSFTAVQGLGLSSGALELTDDITVGGTMVLLNHGAITQTDGVITAANLAIDTDGVLTATGANSVSGATSLTAQDATFNAAGDLNIRVNTTGSATITSTGAVVIDGGGASTGDTLNIQAVNGVSQGAAGLNFTNFGNLTNTTTGGINLTNGSWVNLTGAISAVGQTVTLNVANGGIIQNSGSIINARRLSVTTTQGAVLGEVNQVAELGVIDVGAHNFSFRTLGDLLIDGDITSALNVLLTSATGGVTQTAGSDITAGGGLSVWAETGISLTNAGNNAAKIINLMNLGSGGIDYRQTNGILIDGTVRALNQTVNLTSLAGGISETNNIFFPQIEAGTLNLSAAGAITLHRDNDVDNLGVVTAGGDFTFNDVDGFNLTGNIGAGAMVLTARAGSIVQTGGVITASSLNASATANLDLDRANLVSGDVTLAAGGDAVYRNAGSLRVGGASAGGSISLRSNTGAVTQVGAITGGTLNVAAVTGITLNDAGNDIDALGTLSNTTNGQISFTNAGGFDLIGAITAGGSQFVSLTSMNGGITQQAGGTITAQVLTLSAMFGGATLGGDNDVDALGPIIAGPSFVFNDIDGFDINSVLNAQTADLTAAGAITQSSGNLSVGTLSLKATSVTLDGANNINVLGDVDVTGDMSFSDVNGFLLDGTQTVAGTLALTAGTFITQQGGGLDVGRLEIDAGGNVAINLGGNAIDVLGDVTSASGSIAIVNNTLGALEIDGDVSAAASGQTVYVSSLASGVTMTSAGSITSGANMEVRGGGDVVLGDIGAGGALTVVAAGGSVSSTAAPTIAAARLTGSATTGSFILTGANIDIDEIGYIEVGNTFSITGNNGPLDLSNNIIAQTVVLGTTGAMTQIGGSLDAATGSFSAGGALTLATNNGVDTISLNGASVTYNSFGSFAANVITSPGAVSLTSTNGKITQTASTGRIVADTLTASAATGLEFFGGQNDIRVLAGLSSASGGVTYRDMGGFEITGDINAAGQTVELVSDGTGADGDDIVQTGGIITANRIDGTSAGDLLLDRANVVANVGLLNAGGDLTYRGAGALTLTQNLTAGGALTLTADNGAIMQNGGVVTAVRLNASSTSGVAMSRLNDVDELGDIDGGGGEFSFRDIDDLNLAGDIRSGFGVVLQTGGDLTQSGGSLTTPGLQVFSNGGVDLTGGSNDVDGLSGFTVNNFAFTDIGGFTIDGNLYAGQTMTLAAAGGSINQSAGVLTAATLNASALDEVNLTRANAVATLGNLSAGNRVYFANADSFSISGNIASNTVVLASFDGAVTQTGGTITASELAAEADLGVTLDQAGNDVGAISSITARNGGFTYRDIDSVTLTGPVAVRDVATFNVGGDLAQTAFGVVSAQRVQGSAGGAFALGDAANQVAELGPITADSIAFVTLDGLNLAGDLTSNTYVQLEAGGELTQSVGAVITGATLRAQADGDIILDQGNNLDSITLLHSDAGDITYADVDGFSLDPTSYGDIWTPGTLTLKAGPTGGVSQTNAGLRAGTLVVSAGQDIVLSQQNHIDVLGASSAGGAMFTVVNNGDLEIAGDVSVTDASGVVSLTSTNGGVRQTAGRIDASVVEGSAAGDYRLTSFTGAVGDIASTAGDIDIGNAGDITLRGLLKTGAANSVTLTSGGAIGHGVGRIEAGTLNLSAGTVIALDGAQGNDIDHLGTVSAPSSFAFADDNDFDLAGDIDISAVGGHVGLRSNGGAITQSGGVVTVDNLSLEAATGLDLTGANRVDRLTIANGATGTVVFTNAKALTLLDATSTGDVVIKTTAGLLTSGDVTTSGLISLAGAGGVLSEGFLRTDGDVAVSASAGDIEVRDISAGDDVTVTANGGQAQVWNLTLTGASDGEGTGQNVAISASDSAFLGARDEAGIGLLYPNNLTRSGGAGTIGVTSTGGDAGIFLSSIGSKINTLTAGDATGTATIVAGAGDILAGAVSGHNVVLKATGGDVAPDAVNIGGGDYTLTGRDFSSGAFGFTGAARDVLINDTAGALTLTANVTAQRNLTVNAVGDIVDGTGATALIAGADAIGQGNLTINAANIAANAIGADGDVTLNAGTGHVDVGTLVVMNDYNLSGGTFSAGALSPIGAMAGTWTITGAGPGGFDFTGQMLTYNGDIQINAAHAITGGGAQSIFGSVRIDGPADIDVEGLYAARDVTVTSDAALTVDSATAYGGGVNLTGGSVTVEGFTQASGNVLVTAADGAADVGAATSGGDITVTATNGGARLGSASLTGVKGDVTVSATGGDATLGAVDYASIGTDNVLTRAAGGAGTVTVTASNGDARAYLDHADTALTLLQGDNVDVTVATGDATLGTLTALNGDAYAQALGGGLTIGNATAANGDIGLYALGGDAYVDFADAGGLLQVAAIAGNATLRGARGGAGIAVIAAQNATFGADSKSLITSANYGTTGGCGCGGIVVASTSGNAVVNLDNVVGPFAAISAATGDVNVNLRTGNLTIGELSGRNIAVEVATGSIETGAGGSPVGAKVTGGDYSITAQDFLGDVLNPLLEDEFGAPSALRNYTIVDTLGGLDMTGRSITAQGDIRIEARDGALTGDVRLTSNGGVTLTAAAIQAGAIQAGGDVDLDASAGGVTAASITAKDAISVNAADGDAVLGEAHLLGIGANQLLVNASGDAVLGSVLASGITAANAFTSTGSTTTAQVASAGGDALVHLDTSDTLTSVSAARDVGIVVRNGGFAVGAINAVGGRIDVEGPVGGLTIGRLDAGTDAQVLGTDVTLANGLIGGGLTVDAAGAIAFAGPNGLIDVTGEASLTAGRGIAQASNAGLKAAGLTLDAGDTVSLLGDNDIAVIRAVDVAAGGFGYRSIRAGGVDIVGAINAAGQTVDLRTVNGRLTQSGAGLIVAQRLTGSSDDGVNLRADNLIAELGDFTNAGGDVFLNVGQALNIVGTVDSAKALTIQSDTMTIASTGTVRSSAAGDAAVLASNGVFTNQSGADAVQASNGRWLIYTQAFNDPSGSTAGDAYGGLGGKSFYGTSYDFDGSFGRQVNADNRFIHAYQPVLTVTPVGGTVTYNGQIPTLTATLLGLVNGDTAADAWSGSALITGAASKNVGTYSLGAALGSLLSDLNYAFAFGTGTLVIDPKTLTGAVNAQNKTYDGTTTATGAITLTGVVAGDDVSAAATSYGFGDKNAGLNKVVTASGAALSGDDAGNYRLDPLAAALADILRRDISALVTANDKTYDATTAATGALGLSGVLSGDDLSITGDLLFADKNAGLSKVVSVANARIGGADAGNYNVSIGTDFADIARKVVTGTFVANDKTYDGTTAAGGALTINGVIVGDDATANATYSFADKNAGLNKTVTASATLVGTDAGNYEIASLGTAVADILRKTVTVGVTVDNKIYDGTTAATGSMSVDGLITGDDASVTAGSYSFSDANAGAGKTVAIAGVALTGSGSGNYELAGVPSMLLADILRRQIAISADDKTKLFGQLDPALTYRITAGSLVTGEGFTGGLARAAGESFGGYAIGQGSLALGANYEILFSPGVLEIRPVPGGGQDGGDAFKHLREPKGYDLNWNPTLNFTDDREPVCLGVSGCAPD